VTLLGHFGVSWSHSAPPQWFGVPIVTQLPGNCAPLPSTLSPWIRQWPWDQNTEKVVWWHYNVLFCFAKPINKAVCNSPLKVEPAVLVLAFRPKVITSFFWPSQRVPRLSSAQCALHLLEVKYVHSMGREPNKGCDQARNQGGQNPLENFSPPLEKCVGHSFKILDIVQKIWASLGKLFAPPGVPRWLRAWLRFRKGSENRLRRGDHKPKPEL